MPFQYLKKGKEDNIIGHAASPSSLERCWNSLFGRSYLIMWRKRRLLGIVNMDSRGLAKEKSYLTNL